MKTKVSRRSSKEIETLKKDVVELKKQLLETRSSLLYSRTILLEMVKERFQNKPDDSICWEFPPNEEEEEDESLKSDEVCWVFPPREVEKSLESVNTDWFDITIDPEWDAAKFFSRELYGDLPTDEKTPISHVSMDVPQQ